MGGGAKEGREKEGGLNFSRRLSIDSGQKSGDGCFAMPVHLHRNWPSFHHPALNLRKGVMTFSPVGRIFRLFLESCSRIKMHMQVKINAIFLNA